MNIRQDGFHLIFGASHNRWEKASKTELLSLFIAISQTLKYNRFNLSFIIRLINFFKNNFIQSRISNLIHC